MREKESGEKDLSWVIREETFEFTTMILIVCTIPPHCLLPVMLSCYVSLHIQFSIHSTSAFNTLTKTIEQSYNQLLQQHRAIQTIIVVVSYLGGEPTVKFDYI